MEPVQQFTERTGSRVAPDPALPVGVSREVPSITGKPIQGLLRATFEALDARGVTYCLLRGYEKLVSAERDREVDLLVTPDHLPLLAGILTAKGFVPIPSWGHAPHHFFVAHDRENGSWLKFDVVTDFRYGTPIRALRLGALEPCLRQRRRRDPTYVLSPAMEFHRLLLHCLLHKADFAPTHRTRLTELRMEFERHPELARDVTELVEQELAPALTWNIVTQAIDSQDWGSLVSRRAAVARELFRRDPIGSAWRYLAGRLLRRLRPVLFAMYRHGLCIALLAPDGAGKTTLAQWLAGDVYLRARVIYMGLNIAASTVGLPTTKWFKQHVPLFRGHIWGALLKGLSIGNRLVEQWYRYGVARYHVLRGRFVIFDRFIYDSWLNGRPTTPWKRLKGRLLEIGCPVPDLVVLLDAPPEKLYERKGEHTPEWLARQRQAYLGLRDRMPHIVVVDAARPPDEVRRDVIDLIWRRYREQAEKKETHGSSR